MKISIQTIGMFLTGIYALIMCLMKGNPYVMICMFLAGLAFGMGIVMAAVDIMDSMLK